MHAALGLDATDYDFTVFRITSEITRQVFPLTLDIDDSRFKAGFERLRRIAVANDAARERGGVRGGLQRAGLGLAAAASFVRLFCLPTKRHDLPADARLAPTW